MRFAINAVAMHKQGGGSRHLEGLAAALGRVAPSDEFVLCLDRRFEFQSPGQNVGVRLVRVDAPWRRWLWDQVLLPVWAKRSRLDVIVALFNLGSYWPLVPQVSLQRNALYYCRHHYEQLSSRERRAVSVRRQMAWLTMRASRITVVPSRAMRQMILEYHAHLPASRFQVLAHGYATAQVQGKPLPDDQARQFAGVLDRPVILYISHLEPHKGHDIAIAMLRELKNRGSNACLVVTMDRADWPAGYDRLTARIAADGLAADVINLGRVPESSLAALYQRANFFLFPSLCESFGFPMVEALGFGLPIVAADTAINRELCGDAALYYPPSDAMAAADVAKSVLCSDAERRRIAAAAAVQFPRSHLDWDEYARRFAAILREAAT